MSWLFFITVLVNSLAAGACETADSLDYTIACSDRSKLGPIPWRQPNGLIVNQTSYDAGVAFRVWAPNADSNTAYVVPQGSASWQKTLMTQNSTDGTFYANIGNAQPGDKYTYQFTYKGGSPFTRLDPRAQAITDSSFLTNSTVGDYVFGYEHGGITVKSPVLQGWQDLWSSSVVHDPNFDWGSTQFVKPVNGKLIVYEMHVQTFNVVNGQGTLDTAAEKLDFLASAGINAVELLPVAAFSGPSAGWGYNPCAPFAVLNAIGGYQALKRFVKAANDKGIAVFLDVVWNHMDGGSNILYQYDGQTGSVGNGIYFYSDSRANTPWGPRPNYDSPEVFQYILDSISMWVNEYHISGFRWDSTVCIRLSGDPCYYGTTVIVNGWKLMQQSNDITHLSPFTGWTTAEDTKDFLDVTKATNDGSAGVQGAPGGAGFDDQWEETFYYTAEPGLVLADNSQLDGNGYAKMILLQDSEDPHRVMYTENHDKSSNQQNGRIPGIVDPSGSASNPSIWAVKKSLMGIGLIFTCSGVPMLFYGQEFLTFQKFNYPVPPNLDWSLATSNKGVTSYVSDLSALKTNKNGYSGGLSGTKTNMLFYLNDSQNKVFVYDRYSTDSDHVVVVANMFQTNYPSFALKSMPSDGTWFIRLNGDSTKYSPLLGNYGNSQTSISVSNGAASLMLPSYSMIILTK